MSEASVLIIADEPEFAPMIMARWQTERSVPAFRPTSTTSCSAALLAACDLILIGGVSHVVGPLFNWIDESSKPVIFLVPDCVELQRLRSEYPRFMLIREHEGWVHALVALAAETLRRLDAGARARRAEQVLAQAQGHATLGRYLLDMRHSLNNALTSVLGNSELMLLEPAAFSAEVRDQLTTIHTMAVRIHDILQRFNSMESEITFPAKSHSETKTRIRSLQAAR